MASVLGRMFKSDGTPIRDPKKYVARLENYSGDLYDVDGHQIEDPAAFVEGLGDTLPVALPTARRSSGPGAPMYAAVLFKSDGTPIRDPHKYVANLNLGEYKRDLKDAKGNVIEDPAVFVADLKDLPPPEPRASQAPAWAPHPLLDAVMFKADGTPIRDPVRYVAHLNLDDYKGDLKDATGSCITDPEAFLAGLDEPPTPLPRLERVAPPPRSARGARAPLTAPLAHRSAVSAPSCGGSSERTAMYKADGTPIRDPAAYVHRLDPSEYKQDLFDAKGRVIVNPSHFVSVRLGSSSGIDDAPAAKRPRVAAPVAGAGAFDLFKADGTPVKNPAAYVVAMMKSGGYSGGLFNKSGKEIRDPEAYVARMAQTTVASAPLAATRSHSLPPPPPSGGGRSGCLPGGDSALYKSDGTLVRDPVAYVAGMERKPGGYQGGLFNSKGVEICDPAAYIRRMDAAAAPLLPPRFSAPSLPPYLPPYLPPLPPLPLPGRPAPQGATARGRQPAPPGGAAGSVQLYKADRTPVRDPVAYIRGMEKRPGGYQGGLFNGKGEEIKNPEAYLKGIVDGRGRAPTPRSSARPAPY